MVELPLVDVIQWDQMMVCVTKMVVSVLVNLELEADSVIFVNLGFITFHQQDAYHVTVI
jgi:hypothetical protein